MTAVMALFQCDWMDPRHGVRCTNEQITTSSFCILHAPVSDLDMSKFHAARKRAAQYKLTDSLDSVADELVFVAKDRTEPGATRVRAAEAIMNRSGMPALTASTIDMHAEVHHSSDDIRSDITSILDRLAKRTAEIDDAEEDTLHLPEPPAPAPAPAPTPPDSEIIVDAVLVGE